METKCWLKKEVMEQFILNLESRLLKKYLTLLLKGIQKMVSKKTQYALIFIPYIGTAIVFFIIFYKYAKTLGPIRAWFYGLFPPFIYFAITVYLIDWLFPNFDEGNNRVVMEIINYLRILIIGYLIIITQSFILKKYGLDH